MVMVTNAINDDDGNGNNYKEMLTIMTKIMMLTSAKVKENDGDGTKW